MQYLTTDELVLNTIDADEPEISDYQHVPNTATLAEQLRVCLQEGDDIPKDFTTLFKHDLYAINTSELPDVLDAYKELRVKHEPLSLIEPDFITPLPPLEPAVRGTSCINRVLTPLPGVPAAIPRFASAGIGPL